MADIKTMIVDLERLNVQYKAIAEEFSGKEVPAEKRAEQERIYGEAKGLSEKIAAEQKTADQYKAMAEVDAFLNKPQYRVPRAFNADAEGRKTLLATGWEIKNGIVLAPTSTTVMQEMFTEEVLFGAIPDDDADAAGYFRATRATFQPDYRATYVKYLKLAAKLRDPVMAFTQLTGVEQKALSEGTDTAGGFLVPPDTQAELLVRVAQQAVIRRYARVQVTSRDVLKWPRVQPHGSSGSIYSSGFVGSWAGETPAFSDVDPAFGTFDIAIKKLRVATKLSNDFIADAIVNVLAFLAVNGAENMALTEDKGFIDGNGAALEPKGILNSGAATVDVEGSTANTITNTTTAAGSAPKLIDLAYALPSQYLTGARWLMSRAIEGKVRKLIDAQGRYHWPASGFGVTPRDLLGYPVENSEWMPNDGTDANKVLVFGNLGQYIIAQRAQISTVVLRERFADTDQTGIIIFERVGGDLWNTDAIRIGVV